MARRPSQRRLFRELAAKFGPEVAQAFIDAVNDLTSAVEMQKLILALERRDIDGALSAMHLDGAAFGSMSDKIREAYIAGGQGAVTTMPAAILIGYRFDVGNPRAAEWVRRNGARLITGLMDNEVQQARDYLAAGLLRGASPQSVALDLVGRLNCVTRQRVGGLIGLSKPQRDHVATARQELASSDPKLLKNYLTRKRRDRRFDGTIRKAIREGVRPPKEIAANAATAYANGLLKLRGEVIGRTESLPAVRAAKLEAYEQLVDRGSIAEADIKRTWHSAEDEKVRHSHETLDGTTVGLREVFVSESGALMRYPGDSSLGAPAEEIVACRCDESVEVRRAA